MLVEYKQHIDAVLQLLKNNTIDSNTPTSIAVCSFVCSLALHAVQRQVKVLSYLILIHQTLIVIFQSVILYVNL